MTRYSIVYKDPEATYPAGPQTAEYEARSHAMAWNTALTYGTVVRIFDLDACQTVFSIHWDSNNMGLDQAQLIKENLGV